MQSTSERLSYRFGAFELSPDGRLLTRKQKEIRLPDRHLQVLLVLVANAGRLVPRETLIGSAWGDVAVSDDSLFQAIRRLRSTLGRQPNGQRYIETRVRRGYTFTGVVEVGNAHAPAIATPLTEDPFKAYRAFVDGRAALETLTVEAIGHATQAFSSALKAARDLPPAHIGLANACFLRFESTRADRNPDIAALQLAEQHARAACRLDPASGDAWSTLALVIYRLHRRGDDAVAAARKAVTLEPREWRQHLRLAFVSWGADRLRAATRLIALNPELAIAHWFAATVFVARGAFDIALEHLREGCALQDAQDDRRFVAGGLHLLRGLVLAAQADRAIAQASAGEAMEELSRELEFERSGHVYARECSANAWYAIGALHLRNGRTVDARAAFDEALTRVPGHPLAAAGLRAASGEEVGITAVADVATATARAVALTLRKEHHEAARICAKALVQSPPGADGWSLPVDPMLHITAHPDVWTKTLAVLRDRAS